jgi:hypothetical protein
MSDDNNELALKVIGSPQPADGSSTISADATAYIQQGDVISYPDPLEIVFELPAGGAVFTDTNNQTTSRMTLKESGRIASPVQFLSSNPVNNGMLIAYWKNDPDHTRQQKPFTFAPTSPPSGTVILQCKDLLNSPQTGYVGLDPSYQAQTGLFIDCLPKTPDYLCWLTVVPCADGQVALRTVAFGHLTVWTLPLYEDLQIPNPIFGFDLVPGPLSTFDVDYQNGGQSMTLKWNNKYLAPMFVPALGDNGYTLLAAYKDQLDDNCYFRIFQANP